VASRCAPTQAENNGGVAGESYFFLRGRGQQEGCCCCCRCHTRGCRGGRQHLRPPTSRASSLRTLNPTPSLVTLATADAQNLVKQYAFYMKRALVSLLSPLILSLFCRCCLRCVALGRARKTPPNVGEGGGGAITRETHGLHVRVAVAVAPWRSYLRRRHRAPTTSDERAFCEIRPAPSPALKKTVECCACSTLHRMPPPLSCVLTLDNSRASPHLSLSLYLSLYIHRTTTTCARR
jgi:hypothetical protein